MTPLVSAVCLTCYPRRASMLDEALTSFFRQTLTDSEIVIVNDGNPLRSLHPRCVVVNLPPGFTLGEKRNIGTSVARAQAIATWDDDDISLENRLADQFTVIANGAAYCRSSSMWAADESLRIRGLMIAPAYATNMVTRAALDLVGGYPAISYREDMELYIRLGIRRVPMYTFPVDQPFYVYRRHGSNHSTLSGESADRQADVDVDNPGIAAAQARVDAIISPPVIPYVEPAVIPRTIHQIWIGPKPRPAGLMATWTRMNPSFRHEIWDNERTQAFGFQNAGQIDAQKEWNGKADLMRYEILHRLGGIYIDADAECVRALPDEMLLGDSFSCFENETKRPGLIATGYVGANAGNRLMQLCIDKCAQQDMRSGRAWVTVGPKMFTDVIRDAGYADIRVYPSHYFIPKHHTGLEYQGSGPVYARQHWGSTFNSYEKLAKIR